MNTHEPQDPPRKSSASVEFKSGRLLAVLGLLSGIAIALLLPLITLRYGDRLSPNQLLIIIILSVSIGGLVALTAAFFGTVMPSAVDEGWAKPPRDNPPSARPIDPDPPSSSFGR